MKKNIFNTVKSTLILFACFFYNISSNAHVASFSANTSQSDNLLEKKGFSPAVGFIDDEIDLLAVAEASKQEMLALMQKSKMSLTKKIRKILVKSDIMFDYNYDVCPRYLKPLACVRQIGLRRDSDKNIYLTNLISNQLQAIYRSAQVDSRKQLVIIFIKNVILHEVLHLVGYMHNDSMWDAYREVVEDLKIPSWLNDGKPEESIFAKGIIMERTQQLLERAQNHKESYVDLSSFPKINSADSKSVFTYKICFEPFKKGELVITYFNNYDYDLYAQFEFLKNGLTPNPTEHNSFSAFLYENLPNQSEKESVRSSFAKHISSIDNIISLNKVDTAHVSYEGSLGELVEMSLLEIDMQYYFIFKQENTNIFICY